MNPSYFDSTLIPLLAYLLGAILVMVLMATLTESGFFSLFVAGPVFWVPAMWFAFTGDVPPGEVTVRISLILYVLCILGVLLYFTFSDKSDTDDY